MPSLSSNNKNNPLPPKITLDAELIEGFVRGFLLKRFHIPVDIPLAHKEWWTYCCDPEKYVAIAAPRGHAKSTAITHSYVLANLLFRCHDFIVIVSDTETQAIQFLNDIKMELTDNTELISLFQIDKFLKYTENDIILRFQDGSRSRILAKGSEQAVRGFKWAGRRPGLIVCDDMENDELVMNKERREKFMRWIYGALMPALAPDGIMRVVGTVLHLDSFLESLMPKYWDKRTVRTPLKDYYTGKRGMWKSVRYRAHTDDFSEILWSDRFSERRLKEIRQEYIDRGIPDVYSQEYLNYPLDPTRAYFRTSDFLEMSEATKKNILENKLPVTYFVGIDPAISEKERTDFTAYLVVAMDSERNLYYIESSKDRLDSREIIEEIFRLYQRYHPEFIAIEKEKITQAIGPFLYEKMGTTGIYPIIIQIPHGNKDLETRARSWQGRMRAGSIKFDKGRDDYPVYEAELTTFPRGINDDLVSASAVLGMALDKMAEAPTQRELQEDQLEEEYYRTSFEIDSGRSEHTGY